MFRPRRVVQVSLATTVRDENMLLTDSVESLPLDVLRYTAQEEWILRGGLRLGLHDAQVALSVNVQRDQVLLFEQLKHSACN